MRRQYWVQYKKLYLVLLPVRRCEHHHSVICVVCVSSFVTPHHITSHHTISHHITPHRTTSHHITPHRTAPHHITSHHTTPHHTTSHHPTQPHPTPHHIPIACVYIPKCKNCCIFLNVAHYLIYLFSLSFSCSRLHPLLVFFPTPHSISSLHFRNVSCGLLWMLREFSFFLYLFVARGWR
jgi:hypothetical protein